MRFAPQCRLSRASSASYIERTDAKAQEYLTRRAPIRIYDIAHTIGEAPEARSRIIVSSLRSWAQRSRWGCELNCAMAAVATGVCQKEEQDRLLRKLHGARALFVRPQGQRQYSGLR